MQGKHRILFWHFDVMAWTSQMWMQGWADAQTQNQKTKQLLFNTDSYRLYVLYHCFPYPNHTLVSGRIFVMDFDGYKFVFFIKI